MKLEYTPHNMADVEVKIVTKLFEMLEGEGTWVPKMVDDGGDDYILVTTWSEALEVIDSVEWSALFVTDGIQTSWVSLIHGNGGDLVSDYSCSEASAAEMAAAGAVFGAVIMAVATALLADQSADSGSLAFGALSGAAGGAGQATVNQESIIKNCMAGRGYSVLR